MKKIYLLLLATVAFTFGFTHVNAQVSGSSFSQSNGTYTPLPEGVATLVDSAYYGSVNNILDTKGWAITIPFNFAFNGVTYTSLYANSNGGATLGATTSTGATLISSTTAYEGAMALMNRDLWGIFVSQGVITSGSNVITGVTDFYGIEVGKVMRNTTGIASGTTITAFDAGAGTITLSAAATASTTTGAIGWGTGEIRYHTVGTAPNRVFIVEWKDFEDYSTTANSRSILNFQLHLEETSNKVSFVYGNCSQFVTTARTSQVGLRGATNTDFKNRTSSTDWAATTAGGANNATVTRTDVINPASGLTFTWTPASCFTPSALVASNLTLSSATVSWTAASPAPANGYEYHYNSTNTAPSGAGTPEAGTSVNLSGLTANTNYYFWVRSACSASEFSNWIGPLSFRTGYCLPAASASDTYINDFTTTGGSANISNTASGFTTGGYQDNYASMNATITAGSSLGFNLALVGGTVGAAIWVDLNNNLQFESGERLFVTSGYTSGPISNSITIPGATPAGEYRMRVLIHYNSGVPTDPCASSTRLEAEDYKLTVIAQPTDAMDWVNLQYPGTATTPYGTPITVYTQGYEPGLTEPVGAAGAGITVWIGTSTTDTDPATWPAAAWTAATFNAAQNPTNNNDEYSASIGASLAPGTHYYASRWQLNGGPYRYGAYNSGGGGFWDGTTNVNGVLTITAPLGADCSNPVVVNSYPYTASASTCGMVNDYGVQCSGFYGNGEDMVYQLNITTAGTYNISVTASGGGSYIGWFLKDASNCSTTTPCLDNATSGSGTVAAKDYVFASAGTYYLIIDTWPSPNCSAFDIAINPISCATPVSSAATNVTVTTADANWTPTTGNFIIEYGPTATFTPVGTGAAAGNANNLVVTASNVGTITLTGLTQSTAYSFVVRQDCTGSGGGYSANSTTRNFTTLAPPPANDDCAAPVTIGSVAISSSNNGATQTLAPISCGGFTSSSAPDVWYSFTALSNGDAIVALTNAGSLDAIVEVLSGTCGGTLTSLGCADATAGGDETVSLTNLTAGTTYLVRVYGWGGDMGTFDIGVSGSAMPVAIEYFRGAKQANKNVLDWKVSCTGSTSVTMVLERSADGRSFESIYTASESAARCQQPFNQNDLQPLAGLNYYRLKTIDMDGKIGYSNVVVLMGKAKGFEIVQLAPNPVKDEAILTVTSSDKTIMEIVVRDINGKQISKQRVNIIAGSNQIALNMAKAAAGIYTVNGLTADGEVKTLKFVKQ